MAYDYRIYGLQLQSTQPLPGLLTGQPQQAPDLRVEWGQAAVEAMILQLDWERLWTAELRRRKNIRIWQAAAAEGSYLRLEFFFGAEVLNFIFDPTMSLLWTGCPGGVSLADLQAHLVGPVLGCLLRRRGVLCLHASALAIGGRAVLIVGAKKAGKSTTAAALAQQGAAVLADDLAVISPTDRDFCVQPGYPSMRLWPATIEQLYGATPELPRVYSDREKRYVALDNQEASPAAFYPAALPLAAIYVLGKRLATLPAPAITALTGQAGLLLLLANTFGNYVMNDCLRAQELSLLAQIANRVPIRQVMRPNNLQTLPALSRAILTDLNP